MTKKEVEYYAELKIQLCSEQKLYFCSTSNKYFVKEDHRIYRITLFSKFEFLSQINFLNGFIACQYFR